MKRIMIRVWAGLLGLVLMLSSGCVAGGGQNAFAVYLVSPDVSRNEKLPLDSLPLAEEPLLTDADVVSYDSQSHEMALTAEAAGRLAALQVPVQGLPFVVCAGNERIYSGAVFAPYSSLSYDGVVLLLFPGTVRQNVRFQLGYPEAQSFFTGQDLRNDIRILDVFEACGKLR